MHDTFCQTELKSVAASLQLKYLGLILSVLFLGITGCKREKPRVKMDLYIPAPGKDAAVWVTVSYIDDGKTRKEIHRTASDYDVYRGWWERTSTDHGKTWSELKPLEQAVQQLPGGGMVVYPGKYTYDPKFDILYQPTMRRLWPGMEVYGHSEDKTYNDHCMILENGTERELKFEKGPDFDPKDPFDSVYSLTNRAYLGQRVLVDDDGTAFFPMVCYRGGEKNVRNKGGVVLMRRNPASGVWSPSNQRFISLNVSSRGLQEPDVAILKNGNLLIVCRGSNRQGYAHTTYPDSLQARKWYLTSTDRGKTLSRVKELRYDDGSRFYSPSSIHSFIRSSKNGRLYWLANIVPNIPEGLFPRYPLYIAEIDEEIPAVKKESLVKIDDRREHQPRVRLTNFSVVENPETLDIEIFMTKINEVPNHVHQGSVYKYIFTPPDN